MLFRDVTKDLVHLRRSDAHQLHAHRTIQVVNRDHVAAGDVDHFAKQRRRISVNEIRDDKCKDQNVAFHSQSLKKSPAKTQRRKEDDPLRLCAFAGELTVKVRTLSRASTLLCATRNAHGPGCPACSTPARQNSRDSKAASPSPHLRAKQRARANHRVPCPFLHVEHCAPTKKTPPPQRRDSLPCRLRRELFQQRCRPFPL